MTAATTGPRLKLAFISTIFLLPADAGGKIRTGNILRSMKGGAFDITLLMPATPQQLADWHAELAGMADRVVHWAPAPARPQWMRAAQVFSALPANVANDVNPAGLLQVERTLREGRFDVVVYDFVHAAPMRPGQDHGSRTVCFTHNVETEIFERHASTARGRWMRRLWASQAAKMRRFESQTLRTFDAVVAVSERDARQFERHFGVPQAHPIPTGVDLYFFSWQAPGAPGNAAPPTAVFTGSMDWPANVDGVRFFLAEVWPRVLAHRPDARFNVVGRNPPPALVREAEKLPGVSFSGFVDDVRAYMRPAQAFVIPLRVGGGTRIKAFEAMAMGCPVVSTAIGVEGLDVTPGQHFLLCDSAADQAAGVLRLFEDAPLRQGLSTAARGLVESRYGHRVAAQVFEQICLNTLKAPESVAAG